MWVFRQFVFFWLKGGVRDQPGLSARGQGTAHGAACPACMWAAGPGPAPAATSGGRVCAQLITAMHCTAHVPTAYCFSGHSPSGQRLTPPPGHVSSKQAPEDRDPGGRGPRLQGPPHPESCPPGSGGGAPQGLAGLPSLPLLSRPPPCPAPS